MKRATIIISYLLFQQDISIHALVKRATTFTFRDDSVVDNFNPRPREEGDLFSISSRILKSNFNPRPREEGDGRSDS